MPPPGYPLIEIGIVILVTRPGTLSCCLARLIQQTYDHTKFEIILIMSEGTKITLPETDIKITNVLENNLHLSVRRNKGVQHAHAKFIAFIDDDAIPPANWIEQAIKNISQYQCAGVCGPLWHFDETASLPYQLAGAAIDSFFLEGFEEGAAESQKVRFYNIPLCNCIIKKSVWETVGGFNEKMYHYMDDIEFFYIAWRLGFSFYVIPALGVTHRVEPFPAGFLRKKIITRFHAGINTILFHEIFREMPFIKLAFILYGVIAGVCLLHRHIDVSLYIFISLYLLISFLSASKFFKKHPRIFLLLPLAFGATHMANFLSFTGGILFALGFHKRFQPIVANKLERFKNVGINLECEINNTG